MPRDPLGYMRRAYLPRRYGAGYGQAGADDYSGSFKAGQQFGTSLGDAIMTYHKNQIANQLMNQQEARSQITSQDIGDNLGTLGDEPIIDQPVTHTGGVAEMAMRQQAAKDLRAQQQEDLNQQYKQVQMQHLQAQTGLVGAQARRTRLLPTTKTTKPGKYVAGSGDVQNDTSTDDFGQIQTDFDTQHGRGSYSAFTKNFQNLKSDGKGNLVIMDPDNPGQPLKKSDGTPQYSIPESDGSYWINRYEAARIRSGQPRLSAVRGGINPASGQPDGSQVNPVKVGSNLEMRSLPDGTYVQLQDGSVKRIQRAPRQQTQQQTTDTSADTGADTSGGENQLEAEASGDENAY